jgi:hypothetical protein
MREYILTDQEKQIIKKYLESNEKLEGYRMLLSRCRSIENVKEDLQLIEQFLKKTEK